MPTYHASLASFLDPLTSQVHGMTEVTTDRNDQPVAVGDIHNYAVSCTNISQ